MLLAGFTWRQVAILRAYARYLRQTGTAITRGLIQPRTYGVELQYRF